MSGEERGTVFIEYLLLLVLFAIPISVATLRLGLPLVQAHRQAELILSGALP